MNTQTNLQAFKDIDLSEAKEECKSKENEGGEVKADEGTKAEEKNKEDVSTYLHSSFASHSSHPPFVRHVPSLHIPSSPKPVH